MNRHHQLWPLLGAFGLATLSACTNGSHSNSEENLSIDSVSMTQSFIGGTQFLKPTSGIRGIFEDRAGNLWFTSPDWTCKYTPSDRDSASGGYTYFEQEWAGVVVGGFQEDADGRLIMQNANGFFSYDGNQFTPLTNRKYDAKDQWEMADGDLWFGVDKGVEFNEQEGQWGVYRFHDDEFNFLAFPDSAQGDRHNFYALTSEAMHGKDEMLWFGAFEAAFGFNGETFDFVGREKMGRADDPRDVGIRGYHMDSNGNLWMADNGVGVYVYDGKEVIHFTAIHNLRDEDTDGNSLHRAFSIAEDDAGNFWFGAVYSGIWRYEPSDDNPIGEGTFTNFDDAHGFPSQSVWTIYKTRGGELLFAAEDPGGVYRFNGESFERVF